MNSRKSIPKNNVSSCASAKHIVLARNVRAHWHDCCEMELVLSGRGTHTINGHTYPLQPGDLYLFTPANYHSVTVEEPVELMGIMFDEVLLSEVLYSNVLALEMTGVDLLVNLPQEQRCRVESYFGTVLQELDTGSAEVHSSLYTERLLDCIVVELLRGATGTPSAAVDRQLMTEAILYLHRHYTEPITLTTMAKHLHLAPGYLSTYFKNSIGRSFKDYLIDLRLRHACRLLVNTGMSVTDICFNCGFSSYSHFMRTFRTHYGTSPLQFRRYHKNDTPE